MFVFSHSTSGRPAIHGAESPDAQWGISIMSPATKQQNLKEKTMKTQYDSNPQVGYRRPPVEHQFRPGQSGNPPAVPRARAASNHRREELGEVVSVRDDDNKSVEVTKQRAID